jgi:membrane associated rhomboid family serine protease
MDSAAPDEIVEVFHSFWRSACEERSFMLHAVGIPSQLAWLGRNWAIVVPAAHRETALGHLAQYEHENPPRRRPAPAEPLHRHAWLGSLAYAVVILIVGYLAGALAFDRNWFEAGALLAGPTRAGETWRTITALTLHLDVGHLLSNLGFGTVFGWLAGQLLGPGVAWATVLAAAAAANGVNALLQPSTHASAGASTAVFATLGLLAAYAWRRRRDDGGRWAYRWAPLVAGVILLGFTGAGGERTDVLAHLTGFAAGVVAGVTHASLRVPRGRVSQVLCGTAALLAVAAAWAFALSSG